MRAVVCGAGIAGLTLGWWLQRDGWDVTLLELADGPRQDGYMMDFFGSGYDVAERMGLLGDLRRAATTVSELVYVDPAGRRTGRASYAGLSQVLHGRVLSLMRGRLESVLRAAFDDPPEVRYGTSVAGVANSADGVRITLTDGTSERADLLVGADGIHSRVRALVHGPEERFLRRLGFHTASWLLADPPLHETVGDRFLVTSTPGRQAGIYPTGDGRLATSLIAEVSDDALPEHPAAAVRAGYAGMGQLVDRVLDQLPPGPGLYYDEVAQVELDRWGAGRVTVVGDAAQAVSPMAGQGASLAMGGAWVLAAHLRRRPDDVAAALQAYERHMLPYVRRTQRSGRATARWLVPGSRWRLAVRDRLLGAVDLPGGPVLLRPTMRTVAASVVADGPGRPAARSDG